MGLPWWLRGKECSCQCSRHRIDSSSRKISHALEQLSAQATSLSLCSSTGWTRTPSRVRQVKQMWEKATGMKAWQTLSETWWAELTWKGTETTLSAQSVKLFNAKAVRWRYAGPQSYQKRCGSKGKRASFFSRPPHGQKHGFGCILTRTRNNHLENALSLERLLHLWN